MAGTVEDGTPPAIGGARATPRATVPPRKPPPATAAASSYRGPAFHGALACHFRCTFLHDFYIICTIGARLQWRAAVQYFMGHSTSLGRAEQRTTLCDRCGLLLDRVYLGVP